MSRAVPLLLLMLCACAGTQTDASAHAEPTLGGPSLEAVPAPSTYTPADVRPSFRQAALEALRSGDTRYAVRLLDLAVESGDTRALQDRAIAHLMRGSHQLALADAVEAARLHPSPVTELNLAAIEVRLGLFSRAEPLLRQLVIDPSVGRHAQQLLVVALAATGQIQAAQQEVSELLQMGQPTADLWADAALVAWYGGDAGVAKTALSRALELDASHLGALLLLSEIAAREGDTSTAAAAIEAYLRVSSPRASDRQRMQGRLDQLRAP